MEIALAVLLFILGLALIVKGGSWFVDAAAWIAEVSGLPKVVVGATVVSVATTLPELLVSVIAAAGGKPDMAVGNAVGSVTANLGLILAVSALFAPMLIRRRDYLFKGGLMLAAVAALLVFCLGGRLSAAGAIVLAAIFLIFICENAASAKKNAEAPSRARPSRRELVTNIVKFIAGTAGIVAGADLLVDKGSFLAGVLGVPEGVIAVTVISIGTSLPELATAVTSIAKKQGSLSVGNIIGANIIDVTLILPLCRLASGGALPVSRQSFAVDIPVCLLIGLIALVPALVKSKLMRWQGALMLAVYAAYIAVTVL